MAQTISTISQNQSLLRGLAQASKKQTAGLEPLSSGKKINSAKDDAAGLVISQQLLAELTALDQSARNANEGISFVQIAESGLSSVTANLSRMRDLSLQAANGTLGNEQRNAIQEEVSALQDQISDTLDRSSFNGIDLFKNDINVDLQVGTQAGDKLAIPLKDVVTQLSPIALVDVSSTAGASSALSVIDTALQDVDAFRGDLGAVSERVGSVINNLGTTAVNTAAARSRIADTDFAKAVSEQALHTIQQQSAQAVKVQGNASAQLVLRLLS